MIKLSGKSISPGMAKGPIFIYREEKDREEEVYDIAESQVKDEQRRVEKALAAVSKDLEGLASQVEADMDAQLARVFEAHAAIIEDKTLREDFKKEIADELVGAAWAVRSVFHRWERQLRAGKTGAGQNADDLSDLSKRVRAALAGTRTHPLERFPMRSVLIAKRLLPSDTLLLAGRDAAAALLESGGSGSHAALFARDMGLPCVSHLPDVVERVASGRLALVDADKGEVVIDPSQAAADAFRRKARERRASYSNARRRAQKPAATRDGVSIPVLANIGNREEAEEAVRDGADGVGLVRLEKLYLSRRTAPGREEVLGKLRDMLEPFLSREVCLRLLDLGADKRVSFIESAREENPALGLRGIRLLRELPDLLEMQLGVFAELAADFRLSVLVPMVTLPEDVAGVKEALARAASDRGLPNSPPLGAMIETPAAALSARAIAEHVDFLSVGTNDLTQYTFAADRENASVERYFDDAHEVIFRLIKDVHEAAPRTPLGVCGELAGRPDAIPALLQCGVRVLSVAPPLVPAAKEAVRETNIGGTPGKEGGTDAEE